MKKLKKIKTTLKISKRDSEKRENTTLRIGIDYDIIFRKYFEVSDNKISIIFLNIGLDYGI